MPSSIINIKNTFYINLNHRTDRKIHVEKQLNEIGIKNAKRFNAVFLPDGAIGCGMSHLKCLEHARREQWDHVLIVEDDIQFLNPTLFINQFNTFLNNHTQWDVVLLAGNNLPPYNAIDDTCVQVSYCQTTTGYLIKNHYFDTLIDNIREGILYLIREPDKRFNYAIDKYWISLQKKDQWFLITPLTVSQREDYSDIEKKHTNYKKIMTDLNKEWMFKTSPDIMSINKINFST